MVQRIRIGDLRQRATWNQYKAPGDGFSTSATYASMGSYWAQFSPISVQEEPVADAVRDTVTHSVTMRWVGEISEKDQLVLQRNLPDGTSADVIVEVVQVLDFDELHYLVTLLCKETRG